MHGSSHSGGAATTIPSIHSEASRRSSGSARSGRSFSGAKAFGPVQPEAVSTPGRRENRPDAHGPRFTRCRSVYPEIEPHDNGFLEVGDGYRVYWETCGNPRGKPAVVFHGGPGSGASPVVSDVLRSRRVPARASSTSATRPQHARARATRPPTSATTRRGTWSPTPSSCASSSGSSAGSCSAARLGEHARARLLRDASGSGERDRALERDDRAARGVRLAVPRRPRRASSRSSGSACARSCRRPTSDADVVDAYSAPFVDPDPSVRGNAAFGGACGSRPRPRGRRRRSSRTGSGIPITRSRSLGYQ